MWAIKRSGPSLGPSFMLTLRYFALWYIYGKFLTPPITNTDPADWFNLNSGSNVLSCRVRTSSVCRVVDSKCIRQPVTLALWPLTCWQQSAVLTCRSLYQGSPVALRTNLLSSLGTPIVVIFPTTLVVHVEQSVRCVCLCVSVCLDTYQLGNLWPRYLICRIALILPRSSSKVKIIGQSLRTQEKCCKSGDAS